MRVYSRGQDLTDEVRFEMQVSLQQVIEEEIKQKG